MITNFLREMFFMLDKVIYGFIDDVYGLLLQLTRTSIFDQDIIHSFSIRIYALIGIFMLFKVSISLLTYLINPDEFASKEKGFGIVVRNVILALVILVIAPYVFNEAYELQSMILEENTIMNLIFGTPPSSDDSQETIEFKGTYLDNYVNEAGGKIQFTLLYAFAQPNFEDFAHDKTVADLNSCRDSYAKNADGDFVFRKKVVITKDKEKVNQGETSNYIYELEQECFGVYNSDTDTYEMQSTKGQLYKAFDSVDAGLAYQNYAQGVAQQSFSLFFTKDAMMAKSTDGRYFINYKFALSTAVGVAVLYFLIMFCIDIAIRSVKLGFLEMIAPIPIISYCDPKSGKDGMFKKWLDMLWKTYLELFMRLFALYFGIYVISIVGRFRDVVTGDVVNDFFVNVFMILGVLIFVKKLPEILKEVFNLKGDGKFEFNPLKRIENDALFGKQIAGVAKKGLGVAGGALAGISAAPAFQRGGFESIKKGIQGGWNGDKFSKNYSAARAAGAERHRKLQEMSADGVTRFDEFKEQFGDFFGRESQATKIKRASDRYKLIQDTYKNYETTAAGVDAIAKDIDKRRKAAEEAGQYEEAKRWNAAFDERVRQIARNGGRVATGLGNVDAASSFDNTGAFIGYKDSSGVSTAVTTSTNANTALSNYASQMENLAESLNRTAVGSINGATIIPTDPTVDIKDIKNQAQGVQQAIDSDASNRHANDVAQHVGSGKRSN